MRKAVIILASLIAGLLLGILIADKADWLVEAAGLIGSMWLNALRMTIIPLVVSLLMVGIIQAAAMARAGRMTTRAIVTMMVLLWCSAIMGAFLTPALLTAFPLPTDAAEALRGALATAAPAGGRAALYRVSARDHPHQSGGRRRQ